MLPHHGPGAPAEPVPNDGGAATAPNCVSDLGKHAGGGLVDRGEDGTHRAAGAAGAGALDLREGGAAGDPSDGARGHEVRPQTVRRWRPLRRRDFKMARPARVDIRLRNPCVRARFRVLGW